MFIDGRGDLYEDAGIFDEYLELTQLKPGAFQVLRTHNIQWCLLESKEPLATVLGVHPGLGETIHGRGKHDFRAATTRCIRRT